MKDSNANRVISVTKEGYQCSPQIGFLNAIPAGNTSFSQGVLVKNITENNIVAEILLPSNSIFISTILYPGWNIEIITGIRGVVVDSLQYGY